MRTVSKISGTTATLLTCAIVSACGLSIPDGYVSQSLGMRPAPQREHIAPGRGRDSSPMRPQVHTAAMPILKPRPVETERACLNAGRVRTTAYIQPSSTGGSSFFSFFNAFSGTPSCGAQRPFEVSAVDYGRVSMSPSATLQCAMIPALDLWLRAVVAPAADIHLESQVVGIRSLGSYNCRRINGKFFNSMSQHAFANALDVAAFTLADGRVVTVKRGWRGTRSERAFLRAVHDGACKVFSTVLGPNADRHHHDHFHLDLARHNRTGTYRVCR